MAHDRRSFLAAVAVSTTIVGCAGLPRSARAADPDAVTLDSAYYNPLSLVLRDREIIEKRLAPRNIEVRWVQSLGSNKAVEFLNAGQPGLWLDRRCGSLVPLAELRARRSKPSTFIPSRNGRPW